MIFFNAKIESFKIPSCSLYAVQHLMKKEGFKAKYTKEQQQQK